MTSERSAWLQPEPPQWFNIIDDAIAEDTVGGDITSAFLDPAKLSKWTIEAQAPCVLSGIGIAESLFFPLPEEPRECEVTIHHGDSERVDRGTVVMEGIIPARRGLLLERTALNFLMRLSGIATLTSAYVEKIAGTSAKIVDTRKTTPCLRRLEKYAVRCGGGRNHRMGLYDGVLLKDNHIQAAGSIREAVEKVREYNSHLIKIEVECETLVQVQEAVDCGVEVILLDNMDPFMMADAVRAHRGKVIFEASGGVNLDTVKGIALTGVDLISVGAITHSAPSVPFHLEFADAR